MKKNLKSNYIYIFILIFLGVITHLEWFNFNSTLNFSDWFFWSDQAARELNISFGSWINLFGFGNSNIQIYFNIFKIIWYFITNLGLSYDTATKITFLIPIAIGGFLTPYFFTQKIIKDNLISFIAALFYGTTTYFLLRQTSHIPVAMIYMAAPIFIGIFIKTIKTNSLQNWVIFSVLNLIMIGYELRIVYILYWIILIYWIVFFQKKYLSFEYIKNYFIYGILTLLLNLYWILPTLTGSKDMIEATTNRGLFGGQLFNTQRAIAISESAWTGVYPNMDFIPQSIPIYLFFIPIIILVGLILFNQNKNSIDKKWVSFFGIISLLGILLTAQESGPFLNLYQWLYSYFPGFNLFREASKFYTITAFGYLGLLAISLKVIKDYLSTIKKTKIYYILCTILIIIFLYNTKPLLNKEIQTMFVSRVISSDYIVFRDKIIAENSIFRTIWTPTYSRYGLFTTKNGMISNIDSLNMYWDKLFKFDENNIAKSIINTYEQDFSNNLLDNSNIKYIVVPIRDVANDDNFFRFYGEEKDSNIRDWYIKELDKIDWLEKKDFGFKELVVYENKDYKDRIYLTKEIETVYKNIDAQKVEFTQTTPAEYKIKINNLNGTNYLNFSENYNSNWGLSISSFDWKKVFYNKNYFLDKSKHIKSDINFNSFELSKDYIKTNFDESYYKTNPDGSIDIELTLYFKPQAYFYLGVIVSTSTLLLCFIYLIYIISIKSFSKYNKIKNIIKIKK